MNKLAVYAGSFDPFTYGHRNIVEQALKVFDEVLILISTNDKKTYLLEPSERMFIAWHTLWDEMRERVYLYIAPPNTITAQFCKANALSNILVRGIRSADDASEELQIAWANKLISNDEVQTVFFPADPDKIFISSSMLKELVRAGANTIKCCELLTTQVLIWKQDLVKDPTFWKKRLESVAATVGLEQHRAEEYMRKRREQNT